MLMHNDSWSLQKKESRKPKTLSGCCEESRHSAKDFTSALSVRVATQCTYLPTYLPTAVILTQHAATVLYDFLYKHVYFPKLV